MPHNPSPHHIEAVLREQRLRQWSSWRLRVRCGMCRREATWLVRDIVDGYGPDMTVDQLLRRLTCDATRGGCGHRWPEEVVLLEYVGLHKAARELSLRPIRASGRR